MRRNILLITVILIVIGGLVGWWAGRTDFKPPVPITSTPETNQTAVVSTNAPAEEITEIVIEVPPSQSNTWEDQLDDLLATDKIDEAQKAEKIADMIPGLPEAAQLELSQHLVNLVADEDFAKTAAILRDEKTPASVSQVILDDLFNRDDTLKLPLMLELARNENHPMKAEALENLEMIVGEEHGTNWVEWEKSVEALLKGE